MILNCESEVICSEEAPGATCEPRDKWGKSGVSAGACGAGVCKQDEIPHVILSAKCARYCFSRVVISSLMDLRPTLIDSER